LHTNLLGRLGALLGIIPPVKDYVGRSVMFLNYSDRGKLLDVGCGDGSYLAFMKELGYQALGIDPDPEAVRVAKEYYGITVYCGTIDQVELAEEEFDAITIRHVIEHMHDPMAALQASYKLLKPGGKLVILTPNVRSLIHFLFKDAWSLDPPRHLILFSPKALRRMVEDAGFNVVLFKTIPSPWYLETVWLYRIKQMNARLNVLGSIIFALARIFHLGIAVFHNICHPFLPDRGDEIAIVAEKPRSLISD
jgi:2-polyprenyl-3-methyl-5-hydroxy-6-metoxy-1,4-benzoquinol methylase